MASQERNTNQTNLFGSGTLTNQTIVPKRTAHELKKQDVRTLGMQEKTAFGFYMQYHPLSPLQGVLDGSGFVCSHMLEDLATHDLKHIYLVAELADYKYLKANEKTNISKRKKDNSSYILVLNDVTGTAEAFLTAEIALELNLDLGYLKGKLICIEAELRLNKKGKTSLSALHVWELNDYLKIQSTPLNIGFNMQTENAHTHLQSVRSCCMDTQATSQNGVPIYITMNDSTHNTYTPMVVDTNLTATVSENLLVDLGQINGVENVAFYRKLT